MQTESVGLRCGSKTWNATQLTTPSTFNRQAMSNPEGSREELTTTSRVDGTTTVSLKLPDLPLELILRIASQLGVRDLLAFRKVSLKLEISNHHRLTASKQSNRFTYNATQDKLLWRDILRNLRPPLPRALRSRNLDDLSYPELEKAVFRSNMAERQRLKWWKAKVKLSTTDVRPSILLGFLDDRWIISVPETGPPTIWDAQEDLPVLYKLPESASHFFQDETFAAKAVVDPHQGDIIIALRR